MNDLQAYISERNERRSHYVLPNEHQLPSTTNPCMAEDGYSWIHAYGSAQQRVSPYTGKWLIRLGCAPARYCWEQVRRATEADELGIGSKVSTDWHRKNDPAGPWNDHAICIHTADFKDRDNALRVANTLRRIDAVRKSTLHYKADVMTRAGRYKGNLPGDITIFSCKPPDYDTLIVEDANLAEALRLAEDHA